MHSGVYLPLSASYSGYQCLHLSSNNIRMSKLSRFVSAGVSAYLSVLTKVDASAYLLAQVIVGTSAGNDGYQYLPLSKPTKVCTSAFLSSSFPGSSHAGLISSILAERLALSRPYLAFLCQTIPLTFIPGTILLHSDLSWSSALHS